MKRTFRDRLVDLMKKQRMSSKELALKSGISATWVSYLINGKREASEEVAERIAEALEVPVGHLTGEAASIIINERITDIGMTLEEVAKKAEAPLAFLQNLDDFIPGEDDLAESHELDWDAPIDEYESYKWITRVAEVIGLPASQLRAALARQEIPFPDDLPQTTPEEAFKSTQEDFADIDFSEYAPSIPPYLNDPEAMEYLEEIHKRPEMKTLFDASRKATKKDIEKTIAIIETLKKQSGNEE